MLINRRTFLLRVASFFTTLFLPPIIARAATEHPSNQLKDPWLTIDIVQDHLFPSETDSPGAKEIHAITYLQDVISSSAIDKDEKEFLLNGVKWLNDLSLEKHEAVFTQLSSLQQSDMLHQISKSKAGRRWISKLLSYIFEALLGDPVYGGRFKQAKGMSQPCRDAIQGFRRQALHAGFLGFEHPSSGEAVSWQADLPKDMQAVLKILADDAALIEE